MTEREPVYPTRRTATRAPIDKPVELQFDDAVEIFTGNCGNISIGGMFVALPNPRPPGALVRFALLIDPGASVCGLGEVVWMRATKIGPGRDAGMVI